MDGEEGFDGFGSVGGLEGGEGVGLAGFGEEGELGGGSGIVSLVGELDLGAEELIGSATDDSLRAAGVAVDIGGAKKFLIELDLLV
jgi:hypothetical protein